MSQRALPAAGHDWPQLVAAACFAYFAVRLATLAVLVHPLVPPDEIDHVGRIQAYAATWGLPEDSPGSFAHGLISHRPYLFYWTMGRVWQLAEHLPASSLAVLRLANALLALATAIYGWRWIRLVSGRPLVQILFVVMLTNTLMFTGVGASVTYDNPLHAFAAMGIFHWFAFRRDRRPPNLLWLAIALGAGALSKRTFLPLGFLLVLALVLSEHRALRELLRAPRVALAPLRGRALPLAMLAAMLLSANLFLYGSNLVRFGQLVPDADQVLSLEDAMRNRVFARNRVVERFRQGQLSLEEALDQASRIEHPGNRSRALSLIRALDEPNDRLSADLYLHAWLDIMVSRAVGYQGNPSVLKSGGEIQLYLLVFALAGVGLVRHGRLHGGWQPWALLLAGGYALVLLLLVNLPVYLRYGIPDFQVNGRYLFPVLIPICGLVSHHLLALLPDRLHIPAVVAVSILFLYGDLPWFALHATPCHFVGAEALAECAR